MAIINITCLACGHRANVDSPESFEEGIFHCDECGARMVHGKLVPRVVVEPFKDEKGYLWLRRRFQDPITRADIFVVDFDPQHACSEAKNILSLVIP